MASGRKTLKEELTVLRRYNELMPKYFAVINEHLESDKKDDRQWAVERLDKAFAKMLPQDIDVTSNGNTLSIQWLQPLSPTSPETGLTNSTPQQNAG